MVGNSLQLSSGEETQGLRTRSRDLAAREHERLLAEKLKTVRVYIAGIPVSMDEILRSGLRSLDPNSSYHTEIIEKVKTQVVQVITPAVRSDPAALSTLEKVRALQARLGQLETAMKLSADDVIYLRMLHKHNGLSAADIGKAFDLDASVIAEILAPKRGMFRGKKTILPMRKRDLDI